ncbi:MAG: N-carbamoyl-D-amino-acid hydrolase [candidate division NC10 bacterium RIFCSPLOWO2_12_FULL_66_18]|nr:MAG: N-carbamoyl-D-amino-acid hydrolase [candidate division NC10 bacterium RIFCSPLOWO2_02_FULL_66_22]OGC02966.1 MAG: N-carbamoyl-D-amino-acid hydrolase [candidate division NC10 bacterium RIFCSPLOWO2_12_FULL_66_18]
MSRKFGLAIAQMGPVHRTDTRMQVVKRLLEMLREAKSRGAEFVVLPELALTTFFPHHWMEDQSEVDRFFERSMPNPDVQPLFDEAKQLGLGFYLGYAELTERGEHYNTSILIDREGKIVGRYRKVHLPGHGDHKPDAPFQLLEKRYFLVGDEGFKVWSTVGTKIGMCICNDRRWPETFRVMGLQSAEVVVLGYNTPSHNIHWNESPHLRMFHHQLLLQAHAHENALWVGAAAKCGFEDGCHMFGGSCIVAPTGEIVAQASTEGDEVITYNCDLSLGDNFRKHVFDFARHRRPEHYRLIVERVGAGDPIP